MRSIDLTLYSPIASMALRNLDDDTCITDPHGCPTLLLLKVFGISIVENSGPWSSTENPTQRGESDAYDTDHIFCGTMLHTYAVQADGNALICRE